jgi:aryl-alcohol dehydrogenase-like predicted oxidoreductase
MRLLAHELAHVIQQHGSSGNSYIHRQCSDPDFCTPYTSASEIANAKWKANSIFVPDVVVVPAVNQVEFHPYLYQNELLEFCDKNTIQLEAYSPLTRGKRLNHATILAVAKKYGKTPAQVLIRWSLQHSLVVIPKSIHEYKIRENIQVFDFQLAPEDMKLLDSLNENLQTVFLD